MRNSMNRLLFAAVLRPVHRWLAQSFTCTRDMIGRRWQRKFFGPSDGRQPVTAIHNVELHLVRAGLVREAEPCHRGPADRAECGIDGSGAGCYGIRLMRVVLGLFLAVTLAAAAADSLGIRLVGRYDVDDPRVWGIVVSGDYAYVGHDVEGVIVFDVSDPANPTPVDTIATSGTALHLALDGDYLYVADGNDVSIVDVSDPENASVVGTCSSNGYALGITKVGNYAYVANYNTSPGFAIINVSDPEDPSVVGSCNTPNYASGVAVSGDYAYVAIQDSGMVALDISNKSSPDIVARYESLEVGKVFTCERVHTSGNYAYLTERSEVVVLDITDPPNMSKVTYYDAPHYTSDAEISGHYLYVGCQDLTVVDITDPENPSEVGHYGDEPWILGDNLALGNGYIYSAAESGLVIFQFYGAPPSGQWFVSDSLGDDDNPGTYGEPFKTVQKGVNSAHAGDTVTVLAGTYTEQVTFPRSGVSGYPIVIRGDTNTHGDPLAIIDGSTPVTGSWTAAPEVGTGVYKKVGLDAKLMLWNDYQIIRIRPGAMAGESTFLCDRGFNILNYDSAKDWHPYSPDITTRFWPDVQTIYGVLNDDTTYIRNVDRTWNPDTADLRYAADSVVAFTLSGNDYITIEYLEIQGCARGFVISNSDHNIVQHCVIRNGDTRTHILYSSANNTIRNNTYETGYGPWALLGEWSCSTWPAYSTPARRAAQYALSKYVESEDQSSTNHSIDLYATGTGNVIDSNVIDGGNIAIWLYQAPGTTISDNEIYHHASIGVYFDQRNSGLTVDNNTFLHNNLTFRAAGGGANNDTMTGWLYNNRSYNDSGVGGWLKWYADGYDRRQAKNLWFYHNSVCGGLEVMEIDTVTARRSKMVNNIFSPTNMAFNASATADGEPELYLAFDYNFCGGRYKGSRLESWMFRDRHNQWATDTMAGDINHQVWPLGRQPNWVVPESSTAYRSGLDLSDSFTIRGVTYGPLPGMTPGYFQGERPNLGAAQSPGSPTTIDVAARAILSPTGGHGVGDSIVPSAAFKHVSGQSAETYYVKMAISRGTTQVYVDSVSRTTNPGDSVVVNFAAFVPAVVDSHYTAICFHSLALDTTRANDTARSSFTVAPVDIGVYAIAAPVGQTWRDQPVHPRVVLANNGTSPATFTARFTIDQSSALREGLSVPGGQTAGKCPTVRSGTSVQVDDVISQNPTAGGGSLGPVGKTLSQGATKQGCPSVRTDQAVGSGTAVPIVAVHNPVPVRGGADAPVYDTTQTFTLGPGARDTLTFTKSWTPTVDGDYTGACRVSRDYDSDSTNNYVESTFTVVHADVDAGVTAIVAPTDTVDSGSTVTPQARVRNYGTAAASFPVRFRIGSFYSDSQSVTNLGPGDSALVSFAAWTAVQRGTFVKRCTTALSGDVTPANDTLSGSVTVGFSAADSLNVRLLGEYPNRGGDSHYGQTQFAVVDTLAYLPAEGAGLDIVNVKDPADITLVGNLPTSGSIDAVCVDGSYAYACGSYYLRVVDVSDPTDPTRVGACYASGPTLSAAKYGNYVYCCNGTGGFEIIDVSTPTDPVSVGYCDGSGARYVVKLGDYAYLSTAGIGNGTLAAIDATNPYDPTILDTTTLYRGECIDTYGPDHVLLSDGAWLRMFDVSDPENPVDVADYDIPGYSRGLAVNGHYAYVAADSMGLQVLDISDTTNPTSVGYWYGNGSKVSTAVAANGLVYVADYDAGLQVLQFNAENDVAARAVFSPTGGHGVGDSIVPRAAFKHVSGQSAETYYVKMAISRGTTQVYVDSVSRTTNPGDSVVVNFATFVPTVADSHYTAICFHSMARDTTRANDTAKSSFTVAPADVGVSAISAPVGQIWRDRPVHPCVVLANNGTSPASFSVRFTIDQSSALKAGLCVPGGPVGRTLRQGPTEPDHAGTGTGRTVGGATFPTDAVQNLGPCLGGADALVYDTTETFTLGPGARDTLTFTKSWTPAVDSDYTGACRVTMPYDDDSTNNSMARDFTVRTSWVEREPLPGPPSHLPVKDGAWLTYDSGSGLVFASKGNKSSDFYSYDDAANEWDSLHAIPLGLEDKPPRQGACGVADGSGHIYVAKGNNSLGFWRYDIHRRRWQQLADVPAGSSYRRLKAGSSIAYARIGDSGFVYLLKGPTCEFYRFNVATGTWETLESAPTGSRAKWYDGSFIVFDGNQTIYAHKARYHELWTYDVSTATWSSTQLGGMPFVGWDAISRRSAGGGCGAWFDGGIYALKGGSTGELWRYDATADTWAEFNQLPSLGSYGRARKVSVGGSMVIVEGRLFVLKGNKTCEFWRDSLPSLEAPQIAREGAMAAQTRLGDWQMTIGPNPLAGDFAVVRCNLPKGGSATLDIFDASGRRAYPSLGIRNSEARLDLRSMPAGVYLVKATTDRFSTTHKLVVER